LAVEKFTNILFEIRGSVASVIVNRPEKLNTLSLATLEELRRAVEAVLEKNEVRAAIITGSGEKAFAAGADIYELAKLDASEAKKFAELGQAYSIASRPAASRSSPPSMDTPSAAAASWRSPGYPRCRRERPAGPAGDKVGDHHRFWR
jgi:hypothetical protein